MVNDVNGSLVFVNRYFGFWTELFKNICLFIYCQLLRVAVVFVFFQEISAHQTLNTVIGQGFSVHEFIFPHQYKL